MIYSEDKNSAIDLAIQSLKRTYQLKEEESRNKKTWQNIFSGNSYFSQPLDSLSAPITQVQSVLKESGEVFKFVSEKMRNEIKENPWAFLGKVAMGSFGLGLIVARHVTPGTKVNK